MHAGNASPIRGGRGFYPTVAAPFEIFFGEPRSQLMDIMYDETTARSRAGLAEHTYRKPFYSSVSLPIGVCLSSTRSH
jgi:hypothetical protein